MKVRQLVGVTQWPTLSAPLMFYMAEIIPKLYTLLVESKFNWLTNNYMDNFILVGNGVTG